MLPYLKLTLALSLCSLGCVPANTSQSPRPFLFLAEGPTLEDFADQLDSADVLALSGKARAQGLIGSPVANQADRDVFRVLATPGALLRLVLSPGSGAGADLQPFLVVTDSFGAVLGLQDGAAARSAEVQIVVPSLTDLFVIVQDTRNAKQLTLVGGNAFDYTLSLSEEALNPEDLGPISFNTTETSSVLSQGAGLALFSFRATAGKRYSLLIDPTLVADPAFVPFLAIYAPSFELGATITTDTPRETIRSDFMVFGSGETEVLFGVSDFSGGAGDNYAFEVFLREEP